MIGRTISHYRILEKLGSGGMGVVYKAEDTNLERTVALKFLAAHLLDSGEHKQRFLREAKAAASLDHPNICMVHEVGEAEGQVFLAMSYVDGPEVRAKIQERPLKLDEALDIAIQAGEGLRAAHQKGIVHRDIKSSNLMLTAPGQVKIMDFGLAQLSSGTRLTKTETIIGTPAYMSPEQAQSQATDRRTDIWSLGVVLYEMLTGRLPFEGEREQSVVYSIIHEPHEPITALRVGLPPELDRIVGKALAKNPQERYQHLDDMLVDLRALRGNLSAVRTSSVQATARRNKAVWALAVAAGLLVAAALAFTLIEDSEPPGPGRLAYTQITNFADSVTSPALSPDGRMLTFIRGTETFAGRGEIYVRMLPNGDPVQLTNDGTVKMGPVFLPDGTRIAYSVISPPKNWDTWTVPVLGGEPSRLLTNASALTWIATGSGPRRVLFSEWGEGSHMFIVTSAENRSEALTAYSPPGLDTMAHRSYVSPDGHRMLVVEMEGGWRPCRLVPFAGEGSGELVGPSPGQCTSAAWSPDGKWMYFSANTGDGYHIWRQKFPGGTPEQVTFGASEEEGISFAPDGRSFVTSVGTRQSTLWIHDERGERQITSQGFASLPSFSPDGKKLYYLLRSRANRRFVSGELWVANLETLQSARLLPDFLMEHYDVSPDGSRIVFAAIDEDGHTPIWLAALDGSSPPRRVSPMDAVRVFFRGDGDVFFLGVEDETKKFVYRIRDDGSGLQKVVPNPVGYLTDVSPDGNSVAVAEGVTILVYPAQGGSPTVVCKICGTAGGENRGITPPAVGWSPEGKFLYLNLRGVGQICAVPLPAGQNLPALPPAGIGSVEEAAALPGARMIPEARAYAGASPVVYAFPRVGTQRNIYRISVP